MLNFPGEDIVNEVAGKQAYNWEVLCDEIKDIPTTEHILSRILLKGGIGR